VPAVTYVLGVKASSFVVLLAILVGASIPPTAAAMPSSRSTGHGVGALVGGPLPHDPAINVPRNRDYEPGMAVAPDGSIWIGASDSFIYPSDDPREAVLSGEDIWRSKDGGRTFRWVADPADLTGTNKAPGPGGGDTDIAVASEFNADHTFNVYAVTSWVLGATVSVSRDSGRTWTTDPLGAPPHDRPWITADGACNFYVTYRAPAMPTGEMSLRYDVCSPAGATAGATIASPSGGATLHLDTASGKPTVDNSAASRFRHRLYIPTMGCRGVASNEPVGCPVSVDVAVSRDLGRTFSVSHVADGAGTDPTGSFPMVATDAAGTVYVTWGNWSEVWLAVSHDGGATWRSGLIDTSPASFGALPQVAANRPGEIALAWYGGRATPDEVHVFVARSWDGGRTFSVGVGSPTVHVGGLCSSTAPSCANANDNDLRDDFGVAINPKTDRITVAYTSDRPEGDRAHDFVGYATEKTVRG